MYIILYNGRFISHSLKNEFTSLRFIGSSFKIFDKEEKKKRARK